MTTPSYYARPSFDRQGRPIRNPAAYQQAVAARAAMGSSPPRRRRGARTTKQERTDRNLDRHDGNLMRKHKVDKKLDALGVQSLTKLQMSSIEAEVKQQLAATSESRRSWERFISSIGVAGTPAAGWGREWWQSNSDDSSIRHLKGLEFTFIYIASLTASTFRNSCLLENRARWIMRQTEQDAGAMTDSEVDDTDRNYRINRRERVFYATPIPYEYKTRFNGVIIPPESAFDLYIKNVNKQGGAAYETGLIVATAHSRVIEVGEL